MTTTATPLYDALMAAIEAYDASEEWDADELPEIAAMRDDDAITSADYTAAWGVAWAAYRKPRDAAVEAAREALAASDEPRTYTIHWRDGSGVTEDVVSTPDAIEAEVTRRAESGDYGDDGTTTYVDVQWTCEDGTDDCTTVTIDVPEPICTHNCGPLCPGHDWCSPYSVLGGLKENPGVWGHGGGTVCKEVCVHCGTYRVTDSWAQRPDTGEQGLTEVTYEEADDESLAWVSSRRLDAAIEALSAAGYDTHATTASSAYISDLAPDSEGESTEPGSAWDEECDRLAAEILAIVTPHGCEVTWCDDDLCIAAI